MRIITHYTTGLLVVTVVASLTVSAWFLLPMTVVYVAAGWLDSAQSTKAGLRS